jgi:hypothetical protein
MYFEGGYTYSNFLMNMLGIFAFVVWFWLLVIIYGDLFRRHDISGWGKALWVIALVLTSYLGIFAYLITQGKRHGRAERSANPAGARRIASCGRLQRGGRNHQTGPAEKVGIDNRRRVQTSAHQLDPISIARFGSGHFETSDQSITRQKLNWIQRNPFDCNSLAKFDALARRHP